MAASSSTVFLVAVAVMVTALFAGASAQFSGCVTSIVGLAPCLGYISGNSTTPSTTCCSQLSSVVKSAPQCLCLVLNGGVAQYGITLNQTQALTLPGACSVQTPPVSACAALAGPAASPVPATTAPATGGVKTTPTTPATVGTSDGCSVKASFSSLAFVVLFAYAVVASPTTES